MAEIGYAHNKLVINGRAILLKDIIEGGASGKTPFEKEAFDFIRNWFSDAPSVRFRTSGSTGPPREIAFTKEKIIENAMVSLQTFGLHAGDTALVGLGTRYVAGAMMVLRALVGDLKIVATEPASNPLAAVNLSSPIDAMAVVPYQLESMLSAGFADRLRQVRVVLTGGAPVNGLLRKEILAQLSGNVFITYGMTETLTHVAIDHVTSSEEAFVPLPGVNIDVDERGCLVVRSPVTSGTVVTNDLVELLPGLGFRWLGRADNVINSGGIKIIPERMEKELAEIFILLRIHRRFFIGSLPHDKLGSIVILAVEGNSLAQADENALRNQMSLRFSKYEFPGEILYCPQFVTTETGKIKRMETILNTRDSGTPYH